MVKKYIGITVVLFLGIAAIGIVSYQANVLQEQLFADAAAHPQEAALALSHTNRPKLTIGPISFYPLLPQMLATQLADYGEYQSDEAATTAPLGAVASVLPATASGDALHTFKWYWPRSFTPRTSAATSTLPNTSSTTTSVPKTSTTTPKTATTTT